MRTPTAARPAVRTLSSLVLVALTGLLVLVGLAGPAAAGVRTADVGSVRSADASSAAPAWQDRSAATPLRVEPAADPSESPSPSTGADTDSSNSGDGTGESSVESNDSDDLSIFIPLIILGLLVVAVIVVLLRRRTDAGE